jgi:hypothetical protein
LVSRLRSRLGQSGSSARPDIIVNPIPATVNIPPASGRQSAAALAVAQGHVMRGDVAVDLDLVPLLGWPT